MILYILFQSLIYIFVIYLWLRKRNYFPIKERSPWLVFTSAITCLISCLIIPITYLVHEFSGVEWINPYAYIEDSGIFRFTFYIRSFEVVMNAFIFVPYVLRTIRIWIVFNKKYDSLLVRKIFANEFYLILVQ